MPAKSSHRGAHASHASAPASRASSRGSAHTSHTTTDHKKIRAWVEARGGHPASVKGTQRKGEEAGLLRIDFPGYSGEQSLEPITWDEFFEKFDESGLEMVYQDETRGGKKSNFVKLVAATRGRRNPRE